MILMYHHIDHKAGFNTVSEQAFMEHLFFLKKNFRLLSLDDYLQALRTNEKDPGVAITFDDGYTSFASRALPALKTLGIPATFYIPTHFIGETNTWDVGVNLPIMDEKQIREVLQDPLVTMGAHGMSHKRIGRLTPAEIKEEIVSSKKILEDLFARPVHHFSFPYGQKKDYNAYAMQVAKEAGFHSAVSTNYSRNNSVSNLFSLNRIEIEPGDTLSDFTKKCTSRFHSKYFKQRIKNVLYRTGLL